VRNLLSRLARLLVPVAFLFASSSALAADSCRPGFASAEKLVPVDVWSAAFGDFNEDGRADVVYQRSDSLQNALLGRGNGVFERSKDRPLPANASLDVPALIAADDVNGDGHLDLVFRGPYNSASVAIGHGNGTFDALLTSPMTSSGTWYYADIDGDGRKDFIDHDRGTVTLQRNTGDGKFAAPRTVVQPFGNQSFEFAIGDFDGDGFADIYTAAMASDDGFHQRFWWNDGHGQFPAPSDLVTPDVFQPPTVRILDGYDFDGDGAADILLRDAKTAAITLMSGRDRKIAVRPFDLPASLRAVGFWQLSGMADFDGDGRRDALFRNGVVVWGAPAGAPVEAAQFDLVTSSNTSGANNYGATIADMNGDGVPDIVGSGGGNGLFVVYGKRGSRQLGGGTVSSGGTLSRQFAVGDINGDGLPDVVGEEYVNNAVTVHLADGRGGFAPRPVQRTDSIDINEARLALADLDGDGFADLAFGKPAQVAFGDGAGAFAGNVKFDDARAIGAGRTDATGRNAAFIATAANIEMVTFGGRAATRTPIFPLPAGNVRIFAGDIDGDGIVDLIVDTGSVTQIVKKSAGGWAVDTQLQYGSRKRAVGAFATGDLDLDGRKDLVTCDDTGCNVWMAAASGYLLAATPIQVDGALRGVAVVDVDRDGLPDVVTVGAGNFIDPVLAFVNRNLGGGTFQRVGAADAGPTTNFFAADVDGDGEDELVLFTINGLEVLRTGCAPPRLGVAVSSSGIEGSTAAVVVNAMSAYTFFSGLITLREGSKVLGQQQPFNPNGLVTFSVPLQTTGRHTYTVSYDEQYLGHLEETFTINVDIAPTRRHAAHR
jgi:hypothetical protein